MTTTPEPDYFSNNAINRTDILLFMRSPSVFHQLKTGGVDADDIKAVIDLIDPPANKMDAFSVGGGVHALVFEPDELDKKFTVIDPSVLTSNGQRRGKKWDEYKAHHDKLGVTLVTRSQLALMHMVGQSARRTLGPLLANKGVYEQAVYWEEEHSGSFIDLKAKIDYLFAKPEHKFGFVLDLKTCQNVDDFKWSIKKYGYWMQAAQYIAAFNELYGYEPSFYFAAVEKIPPFRCHLFELSSKTISDAQEIRNRALDGIGKRMLSGDWSDPIQEEITLIDLPLSSGVIEHGE